MKKLSSALMLVSAAIGLSTMSINSYADFLAKPNKMAAVQLININTAPVEHLIKLPGIGSRKAKEIVKYRDLNGKFKSIEEVINVKGIGPKLAEKIKQHISV